MDWMAELICLTVWLQNHRVPQREVMGTARPGKGGATTHFIRRSDEPSLLQAEQSQLPQPVLTGEVFQPSDHLCGPPLDPLQHIHVLPMLGAPELDTGLQVGSHKSGVKGQNHLPRPAGHDSLDAAQDMVGFLGCKRTLLAHVELLIHQYP